MRGAGALVSSEQRSILPSRLALLIREPAARAEKQQCQGRIRALVVGAQPNRRLKLAGAAIQFHL